MTLGEKIAKLRKENHFTQGQLADIFGVSRQAISKWESDAAYPETDKLIRMSELFDCSLDYLLKETVDTDRKDRETQADTAFLLRRILRERKSEKTLWGLPLWHIGRNAKGIFAIGMNARGVIAIGMMARGLVSLGLLSIGIFSFGVLSLGLLAACGLFALGAFSAGCFAAGVLSAGAVSIGVVSLGAIAVGDFSIGALAVGKYLAIGDYAKAMIALGDTKAIGSVYQKLGELTAAEMSEVKRLLDANVPAYFIWLKDFIIESVFTL